MLTVEYAKNPVYVSEDGQHITLLVKFAEFDTELPFTAYSGDNTSHGVELHTRAKAGEFGTIDPYVPLPIADQPQPTTTGAQTL
jgi:hypothetical protein